MGLIRVDFFFFFFLNKIGKEVTREGPYHSGSEWKREWGNPWECYQKYDW
jgi:hypothetical protein